MYMNRTTGYRMAGTEHAWPKVVLISTYKFEVKGYTEVDKGSF